jgi:hypothetical protein
MNMKRILLFVCWIPAVLASSIHAQSDTTFTYQGELMSSGNVANGVFNMQFTMWDAVVRGTQIGVPVTKSVQVCNGKFAVELDFFAAAFDNNGRWLQIQVEGITLDPRFKITRSPYSIQTRGIFVDDIENVGIGTTSPEAALHVQDGSAGNVTARANSSAVFERSTNNYLSILSPDNTERGLLFGDPVSAAHGGILYDTNAAPNGMVFRTGGSVSRMRINSQGDFVVNQRMGVGNPVELPGQVTITDSGDGALFAISADSHHATFPVIFASNTLGTDRNCLL